MMNYDSGVEMGEEIGGGFGVPTHEEEIEIEEMTNDEGFEETRYELLEWGDVETTEEVPQEVETIVRYENWVVIEMEEDWNEGTEEWVERDVTFVHNVDTDTLIYEICT